MTARGKLANNEQRTPGEEHIVNDTSIYEEKKKEPMNLVSFKSVRAERLHAKLPLKTGAVMYRLPFFWITYFKLEKFILHFLKI